NAQTTRTSSDAIRFSSESASARTARGTCWGGTGIGRRNVWAGSIRRKKRRGRRRRLMRPNEPWREMLTDEQRKLLNALDYDSSTGLFRWKANGRGPAKRAGAIAGSMHSSGYVRIKVDGVTYYAHRIAWLIEHGRWPVEEIDHINRNRADNRICNLREATVAENRRNNCGQPARRRSRFKGVIREN